MPAKRADEFKAMLAEQRKERAEEEEKQKRRREEQEKKEKKQKQADFDRRIFKRPRGDRRGKTVVPEPRKKERRGRDEEKIERKDLSVFDFNEPDNPNTRTSKLPPRPPKGRFRDPHPLPQRDESGRQNRAREERRERRAASTGQGPETRSRSQKSLEPPRAPAAPPTQATSRPGPPANNTRSQGRYEQYTAEQVTGVITNSLHIVPYVRRRDAPDEKNPDGRAYDEINPNNDYVILNPIDTPVQAGLAVNNPNDDLNAVAALTLGKTVIVIFNFQDPAHWTGAVIKRTGNNPIEYTAYYIDPLGDTFPLMGINSMAHAFFRELGRHVRLDIHEFQIVQQTDGTSCGPLTAANMVLLAQIDGSIDQLEHLLKEYSDRQVARLRERQLELLRQSDVGRTAADGVEVSEKAAEDDERARQNTNKRRRAEASEAAKGAEGAEGGEGEGKEDDNSIMDFTGGAEDNGGREVGDGMEDGDLNGVRSSRAVKLRGPNDPNRPGGPNNPDEGGIPHFTKYLYNTEDDVPNREVTLNEGETKGDNARYRSLAGELLAYARWGDQQRRDVGDLVVRGNNALLANAVITGDQYDARNLRIRKRNAFGAPGAHKLNARQTYEEYKDKDPLIVGHNIGKKIKKYVAEASSIWPTFAHPANPAYLDIMN